MINGKDASRTDPIINQIQKKTISFDRMSKIINKTKM